MISSERIALKKKKKKAGREEESLCKDIQISTNDKVFEIAFTADSMFFRGGRPSKQVGSYAPKEISKGLTN